jgi:3-mercaptopyruvate sulfurtransferase SseA
MKRTNRILFAILVLVLITLACNMLLPQAAPNSAETQIIESQLTESAGEFPLTEADVPRVTVEEARAALESGEAIIVDVRNPAQYEKSHVAGAISIWLDEIEANPTGLNLDKDQWIITYCT